MPNYFTMAEKVYQNLNQKQHIKHGKEISLLLEKIRKEIQHTELKFLHHSKNPLHSIKCSSTRKLTANLYAIPSIQSSKKFVTWLAHFIEEITFWHKKVKPPYTTKHKNKAEMMNHIRHS